MKDGKLTITRNQSNNLIDIVVEDKITGNSVTKIQIEPEEFAKTLTGLGYQKCQFHTYGVPTLRPAHIKVNKNFKEMLEEVN